ncbi:MAG: hypothetical protein FJ317_03705 [SAR202 cluster bacterium]|nr:hypothetical protein [SAR202 cluster bacterium]
MVGGDEQAKGTEKRPDLTAFINGRFMPQSQVIEEMKQSNFQSSGGFYDHERTFGGRVFRLKDHLNRLYNGLDFTKIDAGMTITEMTDITTQVLEANVPLLGQGEEFLVTQIVSPSPNASPGDKANVVIYCQFLETGHYALNYTHGVKVVTPVTYGMPAGAQEPGRAPMTMPLMMNGEGNITECQGGNFMFVQDGRIKLPDRRHVLPGVSMKTVLEIAEILKIPVDEGDYSPYDVYTADEAFVTSTRFCMAPVASLNGLRIGSAIPGPMTKGLLSAWMEMVELDFVQQALDRSSSQPR